MMVIARIKQANPESGIDEDVITQCHLPLLNLPRRILPTGHVVSFPRAAWERESSAPRRAPCVRIRG